MKKIMWELEESVALMNLYFENGQSLSIERTKVAKLSQSLIRRAKALGWNIDEKFRNVAGLNMQLSCIHFVATNGSEGLSGASKLFYDTYKLYVEDKEKFDAIAREFHAKYS